MSDQSQQILAQFRSNTGDLLATPLNMPSNISVANLQRVCNALLETCTSGSSEDAEDDDAPSQKSFTFFVQEQEVAGTLDATLKKMTYDSERVLEIVYQPQALFRVRAVTRCTGSMPGHAEAVVSAQFSPDGRRMASGSGDKTVRMWDPDTETPLHTCEGHPHWVLCIAWAPDSRTVASGCRAGQIRLWDADSGAQRGRTLTGHKQWITHICWQPRMLCRAAEDDSIGGGGSSCRLLASSSKDGDIRVWDAVLGRCLRVMGGHTQAVTSLRWSGSDRLYSGSQDRSVRVWRPDDGAQLNALQGHGHWVNTLALNTDYALRVGDLLQRLNCSRDHQQLLDERQPTAAAAAAAARASFTAVLDGCGGQERLVSGSDDFTMLLWEPDRSDKPIARLTGHQQLINDVRFSPDGRLLASASFDKSLRLWSGVTGRFVAVLRGHVQAVYVLAWAADSRLLVSGSADSTLKVWSAVNHKLLMDLPGHADQVFALDWSPDGERVVSGGKDKLLRVWRR